MMAGRARGGATGVGAVSRGAATLAEGCPRAAVRTATERPATRATPPATPTTARRSRSAGDGPRSTSECVESQGRVLRRCLRCPRRRRPTPPQLRGGQRRRAGPRPRTRRGAADDAEGDAPTRAAAGDAPAARCTTAAVRRPRYSETPPRPTPSSGQHGSTGATPRKQDHDRRQGATRTAACTTSRAATPRTCRSKERGPAGRPPGPPPRPGLVLHDVLLHVAVVLLLRAAQLQQRGRQPDEQHGDRQLRGWQQHTGQHAGQHVGRLGGAGQPHDARHQAAQHLLQLTEPLSKTDKNSKS